MPALLVSCTHCDSRVVVDEADKGATTQCPHCSSIIDVPRYRPAFDVGLDATEVIDERPKLDLFWGKSISDYMREEGLKSCVDLRPDPEAEQLPPARERTRVFRLEPPGKKTVGDDPASVLETEHGRKYHVGGLIAMGGMGTVLHARDMNIRRPVAMKIMRDIRDLDKIDKLRFVEEAQVTGQLEHPNIVPVHELGVDSRGKVFYTMKYVDGMSLREILTRIRDGDREIIAKHPLNHLLNIFLKACDAVAFANSRGVVHRDLKPENIMVCDFGEVLVMDWGLAKIIGRHEPEPAVEVPANGAPQRFKTSVNSARQEDDSLQTCAGIIMGTPAYMAPEQARGRVNKIDPRTDIYALGGILYHILTLRLPIEGEALREVVRRVMHNEILPPQFWNPDGGHKKEGYTHARLRHCPGGRVPDALAAVALKALSLDPDDRYQSVPELQSEIEAYQGGYATTAEDAGLTRQSVLLVKRHKKECSLIAAAVFLLVATAAGFMFKLRRSERAAVAERNTADNLRVEAVQSLRQSEMTARIAEASEARANRERDAAIRAHASAEEERRRAEEALKQARQENYYSMVSLAEKRVEDLLFEQAEKLLFTMDSEFRGWEWGRLVRLCRLELMVFRPHDMPIADFAVSPDGLLIATAGTDKTIKLTDIVSGKTKAVFKGHESAVRCLAFSPDGALLVSGSDDFTIRLWDVKSGKTQTVLKGHAGTVGSVAFSLDGKEILSGSDDGTARLWDLQTEKTVFTVKGHSSAVRSVAFCPDLQRAFSISDDEVYVWNVNNGRERTRFMGHRGTIYAMAVSPDGRLVATGSGDKTARLWNVKTGNEVLRLTGHDSRVSAVAFSRDGKRVATAGADRTIMVWNVKNGDLEEILRGHSDTVNAVCFTGSGKRLVSTGDDGSLRVWDLARGGDFTSLTGHSNWVSCLAFSPDGKALATGSGDRTVKVWDVNTGRDILTLETGIVNAVAFSPDGRWLATGGEQTVKLRALGGGQTALTFDGHKIGVHAIAFSPDSRRLLTCHWDRKVRVFDVENNKELEPLVGHKGFVRQAVFSPDGKRIATAGGDRTVRLWDAATGALQHTLEGHTAAVNTVAFAANGMLLSGSDDRTVRLWDAVAGKEKLVLKGHARAVRSAAFAADGARVVTVDGKHAKLWDTRTGREVLTLRGAGKVVSFSPDGSRIATNTWDTSAKIWDAVGCGKRRDELDRERREYYLQLMSRETQSASR